MAPRDSNRPYPPSQPNYPPPPSYPMPPGQPARPIPAAKAVPAAPLPAAPIPVAGLPPVQAPVATAYHGAAAPLAQPVGYGPPPGYPQPIAYPQAVAPAQPVAFAQPVTAHGTPYSVPGTPYPAPAAAPRPVQPQPTVARQAPSSPYPVPAAQPLPAAAARPILAARPIPAAAMSAAAIPAAMPATAGGAARPLAKPRPVPAAPAGLVKIRDAEDGEEEEKQATEIVVRKAPPWMVSAVIHMILLIILGLVCFAQIPDPRVQVEVVYAETEGEQLLDDVLQMPTLETPEINDAALVENLPPVEDPFAAPPQLDISMLDANSAVSDIAAPSIGMALTGREKGAKTALLAAYGGTATTEAAVELGLEWLAKQQDKKSGLWSLKGPYADGGGLENEIAATAMALLAFQGAGNTHQNGKHKRVVELGKNALLKLQDADGNFVADGVYNHKLYTQAQATIAIAELYGMTKDPKLKLPAQKALDYAARSQSPTLGGWRYTPREDSDTSVTGWFVMALQSGLMSGLEVQSPTLDAVSKYLDRAGKDGVHYAYRPGEETTIVMTAEAILCRQYLGWPHNEPRMRQSVDEILANPLDYSDQNVYYWYYATQALHHMGGADWNKWNNVMRQAVPSHQTKTGAEAGSWDPTGDRWGHHGGRLYTTCLSIYMLEVYYRHLPIYKH